MSERFEWMLLGVAIGFFFGYIARSLREIKSKVDEVDEHVTGTPQRDEAGFMRNPWISNILILSALALVVFGVCRTNNVAEDVRDGSLLQNRAILCNNEYLTAQAQFFRVYLEEPPATKPEQRAAINEFVQLLDAYAVNEGYLVNASPYTNKDELRECIEEQNTERLKQRE